MFDSEADKMASGDDEPSSALADDEGPSAAKKPRKHRRGKKKKWSSVSLDLPPSAAQDNNQPMDTGVASAAAVSGSGTGDDPLPAGERTSADVKETQTPATSEQPQSAKSFSRPILRPFEVPKAPENSTQFIMDDHENSFLFWDFEQQDGQDCSPAWTSGGGGCAYPGPSYYNDDDVTLPDETAFWEDYSKRDFEKMYRIAKEEQLGQLSREKLIEKIRSTEEKIRGYEEEVQMYSDPRGYLLRLQDQLVDLQRENRRLKDRRTKLKQALAQQKMYALFGSSTPQHVVLPGGVAAAPSAAGSERQPHDDTTTAQPTERVSVTTPSHGKTTDDAAYDDHTISRRTPRDDDGDGGGGEVAMDRDPIVTHHDDVVVPSSAEHSAVSTPLRESTDESMLTDE